MNGFENGDKVQVVQAPLHEHEQANHREYISTLQSSINELSVTHRAHEQALENIKVQIEDKKRDLASVHVAAQDQWENDLADLQIKKGIVLVVLGDAKKELADVIHQREVVLSSIRCSQKEIDAKWESLQIRISDIDRLDKTILDRQTKLDADRIQFEKDKKNQEQEYGRKKSELESRESILIQNEKAFNQRQASLSRR